jgi:putative drug exporter of the RND superfamily
MLALLSSDVVNIGQAGSTICIGLIFDMLIVRLFLVMPLARLLGPWFWWPQRFEAAPNLPYEQAGADSDRSSSSALADSLPGSARYMSTCCPSACATCGTLSWFRHR